MLVIAAFLFYFVGDNRIAGEPAVPSAQVAACPTSDIRRTTIARASATREIAKEPAYTQGLIFTDGQLYESTGLVGHSAIFRLGVDGKRRSELFRIDDQLFGEGLARHSDRFYQLTWKAGLAFAYEYDPSASALVLASTYRYEGDGWGLTEVGDELVLSDGGAALSFVDPKTFSVGRSIPVRIGSESVRNLNELEFTDGEILANIYGDNRIVGIDPETGCVHSIIDASRLVEDISSDLKAVQAPKCSGQCSTWDFVLNGIAYDPGENELYITGKNWPKIFVFRDIVD